MRQIFLTVFLVLSISVSVQSQKLERQMLSIAGGSELVEFQDEVLFISQSVGQSFIGAFQDNELAFRQGFQQPLEFSEHLGISAKNFSVMVYPNPAKREIQLMFDKLPELSIRLTVSDMTGRLVLEKRFDPAKELELNVNSLPAGLYLLGVETNGSKLSTKFIRQE